MSAAAEIKFFSSWFCPFAQRTWIALLHKGVPFEYVEVDPYAKTQELMAVNPRGLVPALDVGGRNVYESLITMEFLEDALPDRSALLPRDPMTKATARIWADYCQKKIVPTFYRLLQQQEQAEQDEARRSLLDNVRVITKAMQEISEDGPFFMGDEFGFVDAAISPWVERFYILKHYRGFEVPGGVTEKDGEFYRFHRWWQAVRQVPAFKGSLCDRERLLAKYQRYADNTAKSEVADAIRSNKALP